MLRAPLVALVIVLSALALAGSARADPRFDPTFGVTLTQPAPQAPSELTLNFRLEGGYQLSSAVFYIPLDWGVARGEEIPIGTRVGAVDAIETYGLINSACSNAIALTFELFNATIDPSRIVSFNDTDESQPIMNTPLDPVTGGYVYIETSAGFGIQDFAEDKDGNGLLDAIDHYPDFLNPALGETRPITRLAGVATLARTPVLLQFLIFAPGTRLDLPERDLLQAMAAYPQSGYPTLMVVQDSRDPERALQPGPITDYCPPRDTSLKLSPIGDGPPLLVNPQSGAYGFTLFTSAKRDADDDGYHNSLDTCPFVPNFGDPTVLNSGDADGDGIDAACDPNDDVVQGGANSDEDGDGYLNRQDNCPLVQGLDETGSPDDQPDQDLDDIGDVCDPNPVTPDGEAIVSVKTAEVIVGDASGSGGPPLAAACPQCYQLGASTPETDAAGEDGQLAVAVGLIAVGAGGVAVVAGSGTLYLIRRRRG